MLAYHSSQEDGVEERWIEASDSELINGCINGESEAWKVLVERYGRLIYTVAMRYDLSEADADDVFQTVCVILLNKLTTLRQPSKIGSWLVSITRRECWKLLRRREITSDPLEEQMENYTDPDELPDEMAARYEEQRRIREAMAKLSKRCRQLIHYLYYDRSNPSYEDIGRSMGMPEGSVGPTRARCLEKLRAVFRKKKRKK
jgi:RNA polymerase sigma factor (sigma-70 family)